MTDLLSVLNVHFPDWHEAPYSITISALSRHTLSVAPQERVCLNEIMKFECEEAVLPKLCPHPFFSGNSSTSLKIGYYDL